MSAMSSGRRSVEMFEQLTKDERICVLLNRQQKTLNHCLPLSAYLFKPVQRILKYHLLLQVLSHKFHLLCGLSLDHIMHLASLFFLLFFYRLLT